MRKKFLKQLWRKTSKGDKKVKKISFIVLALLLALVLFGGCNRRSPSSGKGGQLTLYTWAEMFPQDILDGFESDTGIAVNYVNFDTDETMLTKLQTAGGGDYDLIIADDYIIELAIAEGLVQKLDKSRIPNYGNINPLYQKPFYDPQDEYTVPYGAGVVTLVYDPGRVATPIRQYADLWDPSLRGNVGLLGNYRVINGMALKTLGQSYNTNDIAVISQAGQRLLDLAPNIRLIRDDLLQDDLLSGEIAAAVMYTSQATMAKLENPDLEVAFPAEGIGFGIMGSFIPSKAPNADAAYAFLNYILDAERGAACFEYLGYYSTFSASDPYIDDEYRSFLTLPAGFNINMEMIQNVSAEAEEEHSRIWTAFREQTGR
jgi:spermidine/putrescine-binding protein